MSKPTDLVQGTLDLLILKTIALEIDARLGYRAAHPPGFKDVLQVNQGALYPALQTGWNSRAGLKLSGASPRITGAPNTIPDEIRQEISAERASELGAARSGDRIGLEDGLKFGG